MQTFRLRLLAVSLILATALLVLTDREGHLISPVNGQGPRASRSEAVQLQFQSLINRAELSGPVAVIVGVDVPFTPEGYLSDPASIGAQREAIARAQDNLLSKLPRVSQDTVTRFKYIPYLALNTDAPTLRIINAAPEANTIEENTLEAPSLAESVPLIGAPKAWADGFRGQGQTIAVLDTGIDKAHPFLAGKVVSEACYSSSFGTAESVCPGGVTASTAVGSGIPCEFGDCFHGTHVAGIAAGQGTDFSGVAREANLISIQVFRKETSASGCDTDTVPCARSAVSDQLQGLARVFELSTTFKIAAVNISIGGGTFFSPCDNTQSARKAAIDNLRSVGIATVISAGNDSLTNGLTAPACISTAISVGSTEDGSALGSTVDTVSGFSNIASFLSLLAPGRLIRSSLPGGVFGNLQGTSMAAPHVAGAWAVMKSRSPNASVSEILSSLSNTGLPITDPRSLIVKPRIQVDAAVQSLIGCSYQVSTAPHFLPATGGTFTVQIDSPSNCSWNVVPQSSFVSAASVLRGQGAGSATIAVSENTSILGRVGSVLVAGQQIEIRQAALVPACADRPISPGQSVSASLTATSCSFNINGDLYLAHVYAFNAQRDSRISISANSTAFSPSVDLIGPDSTRIATASAAGTGQPARIPAGGDLIALPATGLYRIVVYAAAGSGAYTLALASSCSFALAQSGQVFSSGGGSGSVVLNSTGAGCPWTAYSDAPWLRVAQQTNGLGSGPVSFVVDQNPTSLVRTGTLKIAAQTFTVRQTGTGTPLNPFPPSIAYSGKLRDRVGRGEVALSTDGDSDGVFVVSFPAGSGQRTVTQVRLTRDRGGAWDTVSGNGLWVLGVAVALDAPLVNNAIGSISTVVNDGGSLTLFAADAGGLFNTGDTFSLSVQFIDGSSVEAACKIAAGSLSPSLSFQGRQRDVVGRGDAALGADGSADGSFRLSFPDGGGQRTLTKLVLLREGGGVWDTIASNGLWVIGVADSTDALSLKNASDGTINFSVFDNSACAAFASDNTGLFSIGTRFSMILEFSDSSSALAETVVSADQNPATLSFTGRLRDRVGQGDTALTADGLADGTFSVTLPSGIGVKTVTGLRLARTNGGVWDTVAGNGLWALGVADSLDSAALRNAANSSVNFSVADGGGFVVFASDNGSLFGLGSVFTLTITFSDGTLTATTTIATEESVPSLTFAGRTVDRVGRGDAALSADGSLDGAFTLSFANIPGTRTITRLVLSRSGGGTWDTISSNGLWVIGVADSTQSTTLRNSADGSVNISLSSGQSLALFVSDNQNLFAAGSSFVLTVSYSDGSAQSIPVTITTLA